MLAGFLEITLSGSSRKFCSCYNSAGSALLAMAASK